MQGRKNAIRLPYDHVPVVDALRIQDTPPGAIGEYWLNLVHNGIGEPINIPFMVARGKEEGPIVGLTAAIHGNELNGIALIQKLFRDLDPTALKGSVVGVLVLNVPGLLMEKRQFNDGSDLNRIAPGRPDGNVSQVYIHRLVQKILPEFEYLIDLHTASFGRVNSWYIRADMNSAKTARMARLQNPEILLHNKPNDGTFRGAASAMGIEAITLELRDPHIFQQNVILEALVGIRNVLYDLGMLEGAVQMHEKPTLLCESSYWIYTDEGGILEVFPPVGSFVQKGQPIAEVRNIFGKLHRQYVAPEYGVVIGKGIDPISPTGGRILHLGIRPKYL